MIRSGFFFKASSRPALPPSATMTSMLNGLSMALTSRMFCGSSSTIRIDDGVFLPRLPSASRSNLTIICSNCWRSIGLVRKSAWPMSNGNDSLLTFEVSTIGMSLVFDSRRRS